MKYRVKHFRGEKMQAIEKKLEYKILFFRLGITQREVAHKLGFTESYISQIIAGKRKSKIFDEWIQRKLYIAELKGVNI
jgi:transcriptional regulator with XRE-family HTH domain